MQNRNMAVPVVYLLLRHRGEYLMMLRKNTSYQDGKWNVCSGHVEAGELPREAMVREAKEELGIEIQQPELVHTSYRTKHDETGDRVDFFFWATKWKGNMQNAEPDKCEELRWFGENDLPENTTPHVRRAIILTKIGSRYSEFDPLWLKKHGLWALG